MGTRCMKLIASFGLALLLLLPLHSAQAESVSGESLELLNFADDDEQGKSGASNDGKKAKKKKPSKKKKSKKKKKKVSPH